ncbi:MAG: alpha/beta fold hydrolase [Pseudonocardiaceae bacterium]
MEGIAPDRSPLSGCPRSFPPRRRSSSRLSSQHHRAISARCGRGLPERPHYLKRRPGVALRVPARTSPTTDPGEGLQPAAVAVYRLEDMADDALAVLDAQGWPSAHVVGVSQGGMIAQAMAIRHPDRVRTLTSLSSGPAPRIGRPRLVVAVPAAPKSSCAQPGSSGRSAPPSGTLGKRLNVYRKRTSETACSRAFRARSSRYPQVVRRRACSDI